MKRHVAALVAIVFLAGLATPRAAHDPAASMAGHELRGVPSLSATRGSTPPRTAGEPIVAPSGAIGTALIGGTLSFVDAKYGPTYLALPFPRGTVATICAVECVTRRSTDYGPDQRVHPDRIADLSAADFVFVCGVPLSAGLCRGTVEIEPPVHPDDDAMRAEDGGPQFTLPPTSVR